MKTSQNRLPGIRTRIHLFAGAICVSLLLVLGSQLSHADIPDAPRSALSGMYEVISSTDPIFPMREQQTWFLDFGKGTSSGDHSGTVAISLRENPNVRSRIMVWQYFPEKGALLIGNQFERGSRKAVARGVWAIGADERHVVLRRDNASIVMRKANTFDY